METFINNNPGEIERLALEDDNDVMPIIKFVSYSVKNKGVRLLIGGKCPGCCMDHMRNTCNVKFCKEVMLPLLSRKFPGEVAYVNPVLTHDKDFVEVVTKLGLRITFPYKSKEYCPFHLIQKFILDKHPDIDSWLKTAFKKSKKEEYNPIENVSRNMVVDAYRFLWFVDKYTTILLSVGDTACGEDDILLAFDEGRNVNFMKLANIDGRAAIEIIDTTFFATNKYIVLKAVVNAQQVFIIDTTI